MSHTKLKANLVCANCLCQFYNLVLGASFCVSFTVVYAIYNRESYAGTVVPECYKDEVESQRKNLNSNPLSKNA